MKIHAILFDLGGVLVRTVDQASRDQLAQNLGLTRKELYDLIFNNESARLATIGKVTTAEHWKQVRAALNLDEEAFANVPDEFWGGDYLDLELVDYIRSLKPKYITALLSNAWDNLRIMLEENWKISDAFDEIFISAEIGVAKPDPKIFQYVVEKLKVSPAEAVFVDDFLDNIETARAFGLNVIRFKDPQQARAELDRLLAEPEQ